MKETFEPHLVGDGYDSEPLWTPRDVAGERATVGVPVGIFQSVGDPESSKSRGVIAKWGATPGGAGAGHAQGAFWGAVTLK